MNTPQNSNEKPVAEFTFPQFMPERSYQYDDLLNEMPLFWATPQFHFASKSDGIGDEDHCRLGAELAAHYVQFARDSQEEGVCECLYRHLLPIVLEAPEGVKGGFLRTIERLLVDHVEAPFVAVKRYERESYDILEEDRKEEVKATDSGSEASENQRTDAGGVTQVILEELLQQSRMDLGSNCYPIDGLYDLIHRLETTAKMLALSVSTGKLEVADGVTAVVAMGEIADTALVFCKHMELQGTTVACKAFKAFVIDTYQVFSESIESRLPNSVEQAAADKLADLATAAVQALDKHTGLDQVRIAA